MRERHPVPVRRLHMHRPERLHRLVAFVRRQLEQSTPALSPTLVALGFGKDFSVLCADFGRFVIARSQRVNVVPVSGESGSSGAATSRWFRFAGRLFIRQHDWSQFRIHFSAVPKLGAPAEQSTLGKSVRAGDSRDAVPGLFAFQHNGELLFAREAAPIGTSVAC